MPSHWKQCTLLKIENRRSANERTTLGSPDKRSQPWSTTWARNMEAEAAVLISKGEVFKKILAPSLYRERARHVG